MADQAVTDRAPSKEVTTTDDDFLMLARKRFDRASSYDAINRKQAIEDLKFKNGEQWPEDIRAQRTIEKRPCLTINKMKTFVHQITNDQRQNRPSINISPVGDRSDPKTAQMLKGLIRQIERQSHADIAYDTAFDGAVSNGFGFWRVITEYEDDKTFDQIIRICRIRNPFRVYIDPDNQEPDGCDMQWAFISDMVPKSEFKEKWPGKDVMSWDAAGIGDEFKNWSTETHIRVAEYFYFDTKTRRLVALANGHVGFHDELAEEMKAKIDADPSFLKSDREVQTKKVMWCTITGKQILERLEWAGKWIPIVKVIGDEADIEGKVTYAGVIRDAKDPQRMKNYWATAKTELIALAPKAPWVMEEGQIEGHESRWKMANQKSYPYLLYKGTSIGGKQAPPPQRQPFAGPPAGVIEAEESSEQDMMATTGIRFDATKSERTYDESGKALRQLKQNTDLGSFHYVDNLARSMRHTGNILVDLIPKIYDTARVVTILREDDSEEQVKIDPTLNKAAASGDGTVKGLYNPNIGKYAVVVNIGPNYDTRRSESADSMINFLKVIPDAAPMIGDLIAKNMDWPGSEEIAERLQAMLPPKVLQTQLDDLDPKAKALVGSIQQQMQQLQRERDKAVAMLGDKEADRQIERDKIDKDFESKMAKVFADYEAKVGAMFNDTAQQISDAVTRFETGMQLHMQDIQHRNELAAQDISHANELATQSMQHQTEMANAPQA